MLHYSCACGNHYPLAGSLIEAVDSCKKCSVSLNAARTELQAAFQSSARIRREAVTELMEEA